MKHPYKRALKENNIILIYWKQIKELGSNIQEKNK